MSTIPTNYCSNCRKLTVCKFATLITQFDGKVKEFNTANTATPVRISITGHNYTCRHKEIL